MMIMFQKKSEWRRRVITNLYDSVRCVVCTDIKVNDVQL